MADFKYDVFISYSHKDEEWVRNVLLPTLEKQGLKVCIDYRTSSQESQRSSTWRMRLKQAVTPYSY